MDGDGAVSSAIVHRVVNPYLYKGLWANTKTNILGFHLYRMEPCTSRE
jgi:hypothetical protein